MKLFLNVSKEEQRRRLLRRIDLPDHNWKFSHADVAEREFWDDYQHAFSETLSHTSTEWAPWYVIPADHKWYARVATASVLVNTLIELDPQYPHVGHDASARSCWPPSGRSKSRRRPVRPPIRTCGDGDD